MNKIVDVEIECIRLNDCTAMKSLPCVKLTFSVRLTVTVVSAQPLKQRSHHLGAAEALEPRPNVLVVPFQSANLQHPGEKKALKLNLGNGNRHLD